MTEFDDAFIARLALARDNPRDYTNLMIAAVDGDAVHDHPFMDLIYDSLECCLRAGKHCVLVMPPEHGKTTIIDRWLIHKKAHSPRLRIGITSGDDGLSKKSLTKIRKIILSDVNRAIFPHMMPDQSRSQARGEWNQTRLYMNGDSTDPSFEVYPLEGQVQGARLDILKLDDIVGISHKTSEADRNRIHSIVHATWLNRLTAGGIAIIPANVFHREDAIHKMAESSAFHTLWLGDNGTDSMYWRVHHPAPGWSHGESGEFALWDAVWPKARLEAKEQSDRLYYKQMFGGKAMLAEECRFPGHEQWARYQPEDLVREINAGGRIYATLDPAGGKFVHKNDFAAIPVVMIGADKLLYMLDIWMAREEPQRQVAKLWEMHEKWSQHGCQGLEHASIEVLPKDQGFIRPAIRHHEDELRKEGNDFWRMSWDLHASNKPKPTRIDGSVRYFTNGWIKWPWNLQELIASSPHWRELVNQIEDFPMGNHDDGPDALAAAIELAVKRGPKLAMTDFSANEKDRLRRKAQAVTERANELVMPNEFGEVKKRKTTPWAM